MNSINKWKGYKFSDFVEINPAVRFNGKEKYSYVEMKDLQDGNKFCFPSAERKPVSGARFQNGDTLFAKITPCLENGKICQVRGLKDGVGFGSTEFFVFRGKTDVSDNNFVFYLSRWDEVRNFAESNFEGTSGRQRVPKTCFDNFYLELPLLKEQTAIAKILSSLDDKIDLFHSQNKTLESLAETLFRQWFVEEAKELWEEVSLEQIISFDPREKIDRSKEYQFFDMRCLSDDSMDISEGIARTVSSGSAFRNGDTLLAKITPCLENGKTGFVMQLSDNQVARGSTEFIVLRSKGDVSPCWVYCLARDNEFRSAAIQSMTGTSGRQRVQIDLLKTVTVKIDKSRMSEFHKLVTAYFSKIKSNQTQIRTLTQLRDTLLPKLMSGEVGINL